MPIPRLWNLLYHFRTRNLTVEAKATYDQWVVTPPAPPVVEPSAVPATVDPRLVPPAWWKDQATAAAEARAVLAARSAR